VLLGLVPESMELAVGLSPRVAPALADLVVRVVDEAESLGVTFQPRRIDVAGTVGSLDLGRLAAATGGTPCTN
jgi:hypothetical protein